MTPSMKSVQTKLLLLLLLAPLHVGAASGEERPVNGFYTGAAFAFGFEQFDGLENIGPPENFEIKNIDEAFGIDVWLGYRFGQHIAVEAQLSYLKGFDADVEGIVGGDVFEDSADLEVLSGSANLKLYPFAGRVEPFVLGGVGGSRVEGAVGDGSLSDSYFIFLVGGGIDFHVTDRASLVVGANYTISSGNFKSANAQPDMITMRVGLQYQF